MISCTNDVKHVDHAVDEIHKQPKEIVVDDVVADAEGFSGGPHDTLVLMDYVHHVAATVWNGEVFVNSLASVPNCHK